MTTRSLDSYLGDMANGLFTDLRLDEVGQREVNKLKNNMRIASGMIFVVVLFAIAVVVVLNMGTFLLTWETAPWMLALTAVVIAVVTGFVFWAVLLDNRGVLNDLYEYQQFLQFVEKSGWKYFEPEGSTKSRVESIDLSSADMNCSLFNNKYPYQLEAVENPTYHWLIGTYTPLASNTSGVRKHFIRMPIADSAPHVIIDSRRNNLLLLRDLIAPKNKSLIRLEGNFSNKFDVYCSLLVDEQHRVLTLLTPDIMHHIDTSLKDWDIELHDKYLWLFRDDETSFRSLFPLKTRNRLELAAEFADKLRRNLTKNRL